MKKIDWSSPRKWSWLLNVFAYNFRRITSRKRDKHIWVFGAKMGKIYDDNCRHLFEYVNKHHPEIVAVWLCETEQLADRIRSCGYKAYTFSSVEGIDYAQKTGVAFYSHGLSDFGIFPRVAGATIVSLWHGVGFKKIYNDTYHGLYKVAKRAMDCCFSWTWRDITIVTSKYVQQQFAGIFGVPAEDNVIAGQPRNDIFKLGLRKEDVLSKMNIDYSKNIILYMPTYRGFSMGKDAMANIVKKLYESEELNKVLDKTNSIFLAKLHPNTPHIDIENRENFIVMDYAAVNDNQALMAVSDMLITDYSSCIVDFALTERPVAFYMPDHDVFIKQAEPVYDVFFDLCKYNNATTVEGLCKLIEHPSKDASLAINDVFEDSTIKGTCYCENVFNVVSKRIGIQ